MKATAIAPSNIAFIKYWGKKDEKLRIPTNSSISMNLSSLTTTTTVEFSSSLKSDDVIIDGQRQQIEIKRVSEHLDRIRKLSGVNKFAKVVSVNSFPARTGLSSSASGFAALTIAGSKAAGLNYSERELSVLARLGSGSACRSIPDGFVEWMAGDSHETSYARSIFPDNYWDIVDIVAVVSNSPKLISTSEGQKRIRNNPFFITRLRGINNKLQKVKELIKEKNFQEFGKLIESDALELHAIMMTSKPPLFYLTPETISLISQVWQWRADGLPVYFTLNTGQDIHLICKAESSHRLLKQVKKLKLVKQIIENKPADGTKFTVNHLF